MIILGTISILTWSMISIGFILDCIDDIKFKFINDPKFDINQFNIIKFYREKLTKNFTFCQLFCCLFKVKYFL